VRLFLRVTWPLIMPAVLVAIVFRALDALRVFDIIYVLTPNNERTRTMSVFARDNLFDFDKFAYGSAASTLLFLIIALLTISFIWATRMNVEADER
ncbi:MAG: sugar ABC transporter permease, partial [Nitratireductor sp.]